METHVLMSTTESKVRCNENHVMPLDTLSIQNRSSSHIYYVVARIEVPLSRSLICIMVPNGYSNFIMRLRPIMGQVDYKTDEYQILIICNYVLSNI